MSLEGVEETCMQCWICRESFQDELGEKNRRPYRMPCGLPACGECWRQSEGSASIVCPLCLGRHQKEDFAQFVVDKEIFMLVQQPTSAISVAESQTDVKCVECEEATAKLWCEVCKDPLCKECSMATHNSKRLRQHPIVGISERTESIPKCEIHRGKDLDLFCLDHFVLVCDFCERVGEHHGHNVIILTDAAEQVRKQYYQRATDLQKESTEVTRTLAKIRTQWKSRVSKDGSDRMEHILVELEQELASIREKVRDSVHSTKAEENRSLGLALRNWSLYNEYIAQQQEEYIASAKKLEDWRLLKHSEEKLGDRDADTVPTGTLRKPSPYVPAEVAPQQQSRVFDELCGDFVRRTLEVMPGGQRMVMATVGAEKHSARGDGGGTVGADFPLESTGKPMGKKGLRGKAAPSEDGGSLPEPSSLKRLSVEMDMSERSSHPTLSASGHSPASISALPSPCSSFAAVTLSGKLYVMGGWNGSRVMDECYCYDWHQRSWVALSPLPIPLCGMHAVQCNGLLYLVGGWTGTTESPTVYSYVPDVDEWYTVSRMPNGVSGHGCTVSSGNIFVVGGRVGTSATRRVSVLSTATLKWHEGPFLSARRTGLSTCLSRGHIFAIGGQSALSRESSHSFVEVKEGHKSAWSTCPGSVTPRSALDTAALGGAIYAIGGVDSTSALNVVEKYSEAAGKWVAVAPLRVARFGHRAVVVENKICVLGGHDGEAALDSVEVYDPVEDRWGLVSRTNR